jgi:hypothetical protein
MWLTLVFGATAALFLAMTLGALFHSRWVRRLPALQDSPTAPGQRSVRCSIVLAPRNEEARIESTIRRFLTQSGVENEVIAVDVHFLNWRNFSSSLKSPMRSGESG